MYEMRTQTSVDNTVNDVCYEIKFENCMKDKYNVLTKQNIAFLSGTKIFFFSETFFLRFLRTPVLKLILNDD